ncbi:alpha-hydroxy acid oxidase [Dictyobacter aurantiacus]|uniref:Alpha-hydroxy-acid oxidizing enzyme n=1 Tax=Dictyobacter aurantiacus TaxID=1936993 RepID=A0A401ZFC5_9CHLR|nr:alpha-hydroxy acid oxidase [Dictyobacter aurantiacus]GCE05575.1 alpha-hydroxy-acid oxidizing enzyme [Dictyobacter aurantiacus]
MDPINLFDYEQLAQQRLPAVIWDHIQGGSDDSLTVRANRQAFERLRLRPRVLVDVSVIETHTTVLGTPIQLPILVGPTAGHMLAHPEGECATAQAAEQAGTIMIVSGFSSRTIEDIRASTQGPLWLQLYSYHSLEVTGQFVQRATAAGYQAIMLTVDTAHLGHREQDIRNNFQRSRFVPLANFIDNDVSETPLRHLVDTWETVDWLRTITHLPIILKGILTPEDALLALQHGVSGIVVSNHGGRQLDGAITSIEALPDIVQAVNGGCEVYLDSGIRRGSDVLKALALGARAVLIGRPVFWGLAVNGGAGVHHVLELLHAELTMSMALAGRPTLSSLDPSLIKMPERRV